MAEFREAKAWQCDSASCHTKARLRDAAPGAATAGQVKASRGKAKAAQVNVSQREVTALPFVALLRKA